MEPLVELNRTPETKQAKLRLLRKHCQDMQQKSRVYYKRFCTLKRRSQCVEAVLMGLAAVTTSTIFITWLGRPDIMVASAVCSSAATVSSAVARVYDLPSKYQSAQTSWLQYGDLHRDITNRLYRNHLSSEDLDVMLTELNARLGLIEDQSLPVSVLVKTCDSPVIK